MRRTIESYDNRKPIIKRESLRGLTIKGKGPTMVQVIGGGPEGTIYIGDSKVKKMTNKRVCKCGVEYTVGPGATGGYQPYKCNCVGTPPGSDNVDRFLRYTGDIPKRHENGTIVIDVNGNTVYAHRKGDVILDAHGEPIIQNPILKRPAPRTIEVEKLDHKDFEALFEKVNAEAKRRMLGGEPVRIEDNPHTVARI